MPPVRDRTHRRSPMADRKSSRPTGHATDATRPTPARRPPSDAPLQFLRAYWNVLVQAAAWLLSLIGSFFLPPPAAIPANEADHVYEFGRFILTAFVGLMIVPTCKYRRQKDV